MKHKFEVGQRVIDYWEQHGIVQSIDISGAVTYYVVRLDSGETRRYFEHQLRAETSQRAALQAENERLRAVIADVKRVATGLYERAPTEGVTELLFYLSVMQREFDLALAGSEE